MRGLCVVWIPGKWVPKSSFENLICGVKLDTGFPNVVGAGCQNNFAHGNKSYSAPPDHPKQPSLMAVARDVAQTEVGVAAVQSRVSSFSRKLGRSCAMNSFHLV